MRKRRHRQRYPCIWKQLLHIPFGLNGFCLNSLHPARDNGASSGSSKGDEVNSSSSAAGIDTYDVLVELVRDESAERNDPPGLPGACGTFSIAFAGRTLLLPGPIVERRGGGGGGGPLLVEGMLGLRTGGSGREDGADEDMGPPP